MLANDFTRDDCQLGHRRVSYDTLRREYVCNECGGRLVVKFTRDGNLIECGRCGSRDFVHQYEIARQKSDAVEVLAGLPPELAAMFETGETAGHKMTLDEWNTIMHPASVEL
jgi:DNA-directed RNA polymerase subunit RPC12/RpoP